MRKTVALPGDGGQMISHVTTTGMLQVKSVQQKEVAFVLTAISYPLRYIGIIMLCVGVTILSVQQLSDLPTCQRNYDVLKKLGASALESGKLIKKQIICFYVLPCCIDILISAGFSIWIGNYFVYYTGLSTGIASYFICTVLLVTLLYSSYFVGTYRYIVRRVV